MRGILVSCIKYLIIVVYLFLVFSYVLFLGIFVKYLANLHSPSSKAELHGAWNRREMVDHIFVNLLS